jgi:NAD-dependent DNA ligase
MAHRYLYYVLSAPVISDYLYDQLEKLALESAPADSPLRKPGSDLASHYSDEIIAMAQNL